MTDPRTDSCDDTTDCRTVMDRLFELLDGALDQPRLGLHQSQLTGMAMQREQPVPY